MSPNDDISFYEVPDPGNMEVAVVGILFPPRLQSKIIVLPVCGSHLVFPRLPVYIFPVSPFISLKSLTQKYADGILVLSM